MKDIKRPTNLIKFTDYISAKFFLIHYNKSCILNTLNVTEEMFDECDKYYETYLYNRWEISEEALEMTTTYSSDEILNKLCEKGFVDKTLLKTCFNSINIDYYDNVYDYAIAIMNSVLLNPSFDIFRDYESHNTYLYISETGQMVYKDDKYVYYGLSKLTDENKHIFIPNDNTSFKYVDGCFFKDNENIYALNSNNLVRIDKCDLNSFNVIGNYYGYDKDRLIYFSGKTIKCNSCNLKMFDNDFYSNIILSEDKVYFDGVLVKDAGANSFIYKGGGYYLDCKNVWYETGRLELLNYEIDTKTFITVNNPWATDKNFVYCHLERHIPNEYHRDIIFKELFETNKEELGDYWYFK